MKSVYTITCSSYGLNLVGVCTNLKEVHSSLARHLDNPPTYLQLVTDFKGRKDRFVTRKEYTHAQGYIFDVAYVPLNTHI